MSGNCKMYQTAVVINYDLPIEVPECMYKTKSFRSPNIVPLRNDTTLPNNLDITEQVGLNSEMAQLNNQQEKILKQLDELREQMLKLKQFLGVSEQCNSINVTPNTNVKEKQMKCGKLYDFVINVNPLNPPYSLLLLQKLWANKLKLVVKSYTHSSVTELPKTAVDFMKLIDNCEFNPSFPCICVRLIWKNVNEKLVLVTSCPTPIYGEINLLRYLSRIGLNEYNYELLKNPNEVDSIMDTCYLLLTAKTKTERHTLLTTLSSKLGKNDWLCDKNISIADIAASSVIKQVLINNELNVHLKKWFTRCENIVN